MAMSGCMRSLEEKFFNCFDGVGREVDGRTVMC